MRILIVVPDQDRATGNWITAERFQKGLCQLGHEVLLLPTGIEPTDAFAEQLEAFQPDRTLLLHAYRCGAPWRKLSLAAPPPYVIVLTGTDVNRDLGDPERRPIMIDALSEAEAILLQNQLLLAPLHEHLPKELHDKVLLLPPGVELGTASFDLREATGSTASDCLFFCPAGIRPVKDLHGLLERFDAVAGQTGDFHLAFSGPILDRAYAENLLAAVDERPWASYCGIIPPTAMAAAISSADVIVNNSVSEGLSNVLLEAATLGVPILARQIPGNAAVVESQRNGLLFDSTAEFSDWAIQLIDNPGFRQLLSHPDPIRFSATVESRLLDGTLTAIGQQRS